jgi:hypothetical protein
MPRWRDPKIGPLRGALERSALDRQRIDRARVIDDASRSFRPRYQRLTCSDATTLHRDLP